MPTAASARLLAEELEEGNVAPTVVWTAKERPTRSSCAVWIAVLMAILMFLLGVCFGAFLNALTPDGALPLGFLGSNELPTNKSLLPLNSSLSDDLEDLDSLEEVSTTLDNSEDEEAEEINLSEEKIEVLNEEEQTTPASGEKSEEDVSEEQQEEPTTKSPKIERKNKKCPNFPWSSQRLPNDLKPRHYNMTIHPNATTHSLEGMSKIQIEVEDKTDLIVLHAERLILEAFRLEVNSEAMDAEHFDCPSLAMWAFKTRKHIYPNQNVELEMNFKGKVLADLHGLYVSTHTDEKHEKRNSMVTQFEPSAARRAFPCFDEPSFKAEFRLSVVREPGHVVRSNVNLKRTTERYDGLYLDEFTPTVKMSTYLVAFAVLDGYNYARRVAKKTSRPIEVRLYAPADVLEGQSEFGLDTAVRALEFFEDYFNISYPLEKIDLLALDDFSEGAMENWGMVTFRDTALLYAPNSSALFREYIALVICHEIAHQWFGNLVTMNWWDDLWLNEGFANYMEYRCVDSLYPSWKIVSNLRDQRRFQMTRFFVDNLANSMEHDGISTSRAIASAEEGQALINLFDAIAYHKAAAVIHMIQHLAGEKNFRLALIEYLNKYKYANAEGEELWKIVEKNAHLGKGISIRGLADQFTTQVGYPVIKVSRKKDIITAGSQTRFFYDKTRKDKDSDWPLHISFKIDGEEEIRTKWLKEDEKEVSIRAPKESDWVIANTGGIGYFKVQYDEGIYAKLAEQLEENHEELSAVDRTMILTDAFELARGARLNITTYLNLIQYADEESDRIVWLQLLRHLKIVEYMIADTDFSNIFKDFERSLLLPAYDRFAWNETAEPALKLELVQFACRMRIRDCTKKTLAAYNEWQKNKVRPLPELVGVVLEEGIRQGGSTAFERALVSLVNETRTVTEKQHLLSAIAATRSPDLINKMLKLCTDQNSPIRPATVPRVIHHLMANEVARPIAWRYFKMHFDEFVKISNLLVSCIRAAEKISTEEELRELQDFLKNKKAVSQSGAKLEQLYEQIRINIQWRRLHEENLRDWLTEWDQRRRIVGRF